ncbi:MAG: FliG C-terminal domain-containing protein [Thermoguttaceae bacterium]|jgi:flagellar motor switch protein FliG
MKAIAQNPANAGIRKAAILVACLDRSAADAVLEQLGPEQAQRVRQAVVVLDDIPDNEQQRVVDEFFRLGPQSPLQQSYGVELGGRLAREISLKPSAPTAGKPASNGLHSPPFVRLREAEDEKLARLLAGERPQTIALVLSHLSARQAGGVLARLQPNLQTEVIRRLVDLEETDPAILREVEQALESRLSQQVPMQRRRVAGLQAMDGILQASESNVRLQILDNLAAHDRALAQRLGPPPMEFDDLADLDDAALAEVFRAAQPQWIMPALLGAPPEISDRVLNLFPRNQAQSLRRNLERPGPIRLSDVETARQNIAEIAARIVYAKGKIALGAA